MSICIFNRDYFKVKHDHCDHSVTIITSAFVKFMIVHFCVLCCFGTAQVLDWTRETGSFGADYGRAVCVSGDEKYIYVAGYAQESLNGQPSAGNIQQFLFCITRTGRLRHRS